MWEEAGLRALRGPDIVCVHTLPSRTSHMRTSAGRSQLVAHACIRSVAPIDHFREQARLGGRGRAGGHN